MEKIKIITDSTSDLPKELISKYDLEVLPLIVSFGEEQYIDGVDLNLHDFLIKMKESPALPTTSQINPQRFFDCYKKYIDEGYKILSIHVSSKMSGTYQSACIAKEMLETNAITVIDSLNVSSGLGILVVKACKLKQAGANIEEITREIENTIPLVKSALIFDNLNNLVKGGRLSKASGLIGNALGIKLIIEVKNGEVSVLDKVRGMKKATRTVLDYINEKGIREGETFALLDVESVEAYDILKENIKEINSNFIECEVGCVVGTHSGEGACGVFFIENRA